jgi:hypothetical protein
VRHLRKHSRLAISFSVLACIVGSFFTSVPRAQAAPFTCTSGLYQEVNGQLRVLDPSSNTFTTIGPNHAININAMGYNPTYNYIYALLFSNSHLLRIENDGTYTDLGVPAGLPGTGYAAGDFDQSGNMYVKAAGDFYVINVTTNTATVLTLSNNFATAEAVYINGFLYSVGNGVSTGNLFKVDVSNGTVTNLPIALADGGFGAGWATDINSLYFSSNATGVVYQITNYNTAPVPVAVMNSSPTNQNDGAACFTAPTPIPPLLATDKTGSTVINQQLVVSAAAGLLIDDTGKDITVTSNTQPTNGTVIVTPDGSYTYTPNADFTGTDTFTYTITDAFNITATATVTITVGAATVVPTNANTLAPTGCSQLPYYLLAGVLILLAGSSLVVADRLAN